MINREKIPNYSENEEIKSLLFDVFGERNGNKILEKVYKNDGFLESFFKSWGSFVDDKKTTFGIIEIIKNRDIPEVLRMAKNINFENLDKKKMFKTIGYLGYISNVFSELGRQNKFEEYEKLSEEISKINSYDSLASAMDKFIKKWHEITKLS